MTEPCRHSARNWIVGEGHVELAEARRRAVAEVEELEAALEQARAAEQEAFAARREAIAVHDQATNKRNATMAALLAARHTLHYRMGQTNLTCNPPFPAAER